MTKQMQSDEIWQKFIESSVAELAYEQQIQKLTELKKIESERRQHYFNLLDAQNLVKPSQKA
ncbi:hypothetical protein [Runella zeae]|uniref:hypothetical protein n=1 Tax=Runella zeae TaxID=94255 RepID=UPI0004169156|nr:hypothetical protein [Runella zeae]